MVMLTPQCSKNVTTRKHTLAPMTHTFIQQTYNRQQLYRVQHSQQLLTSFGTPLLRHTRHAAQSALLRVLRSVVTVCLVTALVVTTSRTTEV